MRIGLDRVQDDPTLLKGLGRVGLVVNQAVAASDFTSAVDVVSRACEVAKGAQFACVFGPQHGYSQSEQYNMAETADSEIKLVTGQTVPLFSLYSETRLPTAEQLALVDTLIVDLLDIGGRVYTYMITLAGCLREAARTGKRVVVLDRPNPLGLSHFDNKSGRFLNVAGNRLDLRFQSFVGWYPLPMRYGLTLGELGRYFIQEDKLDVDYRVVTVEGLSRDVPIETLQRMPWTLPSPNMPSWRTAFLFPGMVALEGTNLSEGRGTTLPFEVVGAPYLDARGCRRWLTAQSLRPGASLSMKSLAGFAAREHDFRPTFNTHAGDVCNGLHWHIADARLGCAFTLGISFLFYVNATSGERFRWREPGYEYDFTHNPILLILGDARWLALFDGVRKDGTPDAPTHRDALEQALAWADAEAQAFASSTVSSHLYPGPSESPSSLASPSARG